MNDWSYIHVYNESLSFWSQVLEYEYNKNDHSQGQQIPV